MVNGDAYYQSMDKEAYEVITKYANLNNEEAVGINKYQRKDGRVNVCKGIKDLMENSKTEGIAMGRTEGIKEMIIKMLTSFLPKRVKQ